METVEQTVDVGISKQPSEEESVDKNVKREDTVDSEKNNVGEADNKPKVNVDEKGNPEINDHVRLENNKYVYTDPNSKIEYTWNTETSKWETKNQPHFDGKTYRYKDEKSGENYKWNTDTNSWDKIQVYGYDGENHTYTDPSDGTVYIWDREKNAWFPKVDDDFLANYQMNYGFVEPKEEKTEIKEEKQLKRKPEETNSWFNLDDEHNTKVYVSNLPSDITEQEFIDLMQKCGLVMKDVNTNKWKIKLYTDSDSGELKGDGLCSYIKKESVELALNILDGYEIRNKKIKVERAKFQMKGDFNPALKPRKKRKKEKEKEKKFQQKLFEWRPDKLRGEREKNERTVIIKNLFDPKIFDEDVKLILEYNQDLREECEKCGVIRKLILYDKHPEGVAQVTFSDAEEADICIKLLNNRWFGQRKISAETWDGKTKYKITETEDEAKKRLENWQKYLESEEKKNA